MRLHHLLAASFIALSLAAPAPASAVTYYVNTSNVTGNDGVFNNRGPGQFSAPSWTFSVTNSYDLGGGNFLMKNPAAQDNIYLTLYSGLAPNSFVQFNSVTGQPQNNGLGSDNIVAQKGFSPSQFYAACALGYTCTSSWEPVAFWFDSAATLAPGDYFLELTSRAATNDKYSIKYDVNAVVAFNNDTGTIVDPNTGNAVDTPEPASALAMIAGLMGLGLVRRRQAPAA